MPHNVDFKNHALDLKTQSEAEMTSSQNSPINLKHILNSNKLA